MKTFEILALCALCVVPTGCVTTAAPGTFATPREAMQRLASAGEDQELADELLGPGGFSLLRSGDDAADREDFEAVRALILERVDFVDVTEDCKIALLGAEGWEYPLPLVREQGRWRFDVEAGREEILNRRVGRNELSTIATMHALVEAQREYAAEGRDGNPPAFAPQILSSEGRHDGLYWPVAEGQAASPLGPLVGAAADQRQQRDGSGPVPYHGYFYRALTAQGPSAPGGARSFVDSKGLLTGGFAFLAWPATHGNSGVMSFIVNQQGIVFERDLGPDTAHSASSIQSYDPDISWTPTKD